MIQQATSSCSVHFDYRDIGTTCSCSSVLVDGDATQTQLSGKDAVDVLDADVAAVDRPSAGDVLPTGHRQLQRTPVVIVEATTSAQLIR